MNTETKQFDKKFQRTRWLIWSILVLAYAINFFHSLSMGVVKDSIMAEFSLTESNFVSIANTYAALYLIMQIPTGILLDTLGAKITSGVGMFLASAGIILFSITNEVSMLFLGRAMIGLGSSVIYVAILKIQSKWFECEKFGTMTGITCFIGALGGAVAQAPLAFAANALGWRNAFLAIGMLSLVVCGAIFLFVKNTPQEKGYAALPGTETATSIPTLKELCAGTVAVFKNPYTWPPFLSYAAFYGSFVILMGYWGTAFVSDTFGISKVAAANFTTIGVLGSAIGAVVIGNLSDKYRTRRKPALYTGILYCFSWVALIWGSKFIPLPAMGVLMFAIGFLSYGYVVSWPAVKEVNNPDYVGVSTSIANIGGFMGNILLPMVVGFSFDRFGSSYGTQTMYQIAFGIVLVTVILGTIVSHFIKETKCENIYQKK